MAAPQGHFIAAPHPWPVQSSHTFKLTPRTLGVDVFSENNRKMSKLPWVAASTRAWHTQLGCQAGLQGRHVPLQLIPSCQQTHDSCSHGRAEALPAVGRPSGQGSGGSCASTAADREGGGDFCCFRKWGPLQSAREGRPDSVVVLHPSSGDGREPGLSPFLALVDFLCRQLPLFGVRGRRRGKGQVAVSRKGCSEKQKKRKELFSFLRAKMIKRTLHRPEHV